MSLPLPCLAKREKDRNHGLYGLALPSFAFGGNYDHNRLGEQDAQLIGCVSSILPEVLWLPSGRSPTRYRETRLDVPPLLHNNHGPGDLLTRPAPLPGSLHLEWRRCGDPTCHCHTGSQHGPYWVRRWREGGKSRKVYVRKQEILSVMHGLELWRELHPPTSSIRQRLVELHKREREVLA